jgi:hypothetical protein
VTGAGLSDDELRWMFSLLARYAATDLDQWENWRVPTLQGDVFIEVRRTTPSEPTAYDDITAWRERG